MSDKLYEAFRIYLLEGLLGVELENVLQVLNNKGYVEGTEKRDQAIDAYMKVINDPVLKTMIPELSSYDLNNPGTDIKTLYGIRKRELESKATITTTEKGNVEKLKTDGSSVPYSGAPVAAMGVAENASIGASAAIAAGQVTEPEIKTTGTDPLPVESTTVTIEPTPSVPSTDFVEDIKKVKEKIASTKEVVVEEPTLEPSVRMPVETSQDQINKEKIKGLRLNEVGYANVVLMSIIVMIIVAIICVFIFA